MTPSQTPADPRELVLTLIEIINGTRSVESASDCLESNVLIHMDTAVHRGIIIWRKWIHMIRHCGKVRNLRLDPSAIAIDPAETDILNLAFTWSGERLSQQERMRTFSNLHHLRYRVKNSQITEIWTQKQNYVFIFGPWIRYSFCYRILLLWGIFYFRLRARRKS